MSSHSYNCHRGIVSTGTSNYLIEKELKVDKRVLSMMENGGNENLPSLDDFLNNIQHQTGVSIAILKLTRDRQGNEIPVFRLKAFCQKNIDVASALIMEYLDPHRDKMTFNIDVPFNDHSHIIGKDGLRIKQLSNETGCHIHLPDCNKTGGKKSNKLSIAGTEFDAIEKARNQIRRSLPLNIGFKAILKCKQFISIDTSSSEVQAIKRKYRVDVTFTNVNPTAIAKYPEITINVKGSRSQLEEIKSAIHDLYRVVTGDLMLQNFSIDFFIAMNITHSHHQYVKGKNNCNLNVIHQRTKAQVIFPQNSAENNNIVMIKSDDLLTTVMGWQELMGYLPLLLSFDVNFDINQVQDRIAKIEKDNGVGIRNREKVSGHVYTVLVKTQERHSINLYEIREMILNLKPKAFTNKLLMSKENLSKFSTRNHFAGDVFTDHLYNFKMTSPNMELLKTRNNNISCLEDFSNCCSLNDSSDDHSDDYLDRINFCPDIFCQKEIQNQQQLLKQSYRSSFNLQKYLSNESVFTFNNNFKNEIDQYWDDIPKNIEHSIRSSNFEFQSIQAHQQSIYQQQQQQQRKCQLSSSLIRQIFEKISSDDFSDRSIDNEKLYRHNPQLSNFYDYYLSSNQRI